MERVASGNSLLSPVKILGQANVGYGETVADLGIGAQAHFTMQAAKIVGDRGKVYGVDILKSVVKNLESQAKVAGLQNITPIWSNLEVIGGAKKIGDETVDVALIINVLFQSSAKKENIFKEAHRMLKPGGRLLVIDWKKRPSPMGPPVTIRLSQDEVLASLQKVGYELDKEFEAGDHHWGLLVTKI